MNSIIIIVIRKTNGNQEMFSSGTLGKFKLEGGSGTDKKRVIDK